MRTAHLLGHVTEAPPPAASPVDSPRFGVHSMRLVDGVLLDFPLAVPVGGRCWVATVWPDPANRSGWSGVRWQRDVTQGRGWLWPPRIAVGDVVEFGIEGRGRRRKTLATRSFGLIVDYDGSWILSVQGPYEHPGQAHADAMAIIRGRSNPSPPPTAPPPAAPIRAAHRGRVSTHHR